MSQLFPTIAAITTSLSLLLPAAELKMDAPGAVAPILISLPENHDPSKSWPAVFTYHGTNGQPNTRNTRLHTGTRDWIVVGMSYTQHGQFRLTPADIENELKVFRHVRDELARNQGLDPKRLYITGYSKGGWMTDTLLQAEPALAGGAILMGGHLPTPIKNAAPIGKDTEVFIGVGRLDPNYLSSLKALIYYRGLGLNTSFEAWPEIGHDFPREGSVGLREWFALRNGEKPDEQALEDEFKSCLELDPIEAWHALTKLEDRPFCTTPDSHWPEKLSLAQKKFEQDPNVAREAKIRTTHRQLLGREIKMQTLEELRKIDAAYMALSGASVDSPQADEILVDHRRILAVLEQANAVPVPKQEPAPLTPDLPKNEPSIPRNPLVR